MFSVIKCFSILTALYIVYGNFCDIDPTDRVMCSTNTTKTECLQQGCCWTNQSNTSTPHCYIPSETKFTICKGQKRQLQCPNGTYLQINSMFYGRKDNATCPDNTYNTHLSHTNCSTPPGSYEKLRTFCSGRNSCWFIATYFQWGIDENQPECNGIHREATVGYACKACVNKYSDNKCKRMRNDGKCVSQYSMMTENCFKTCTQCGTKDCGNLYRGPDGPEACDKWAMNTAGECNRNSDFMLKQCEESCLSCGLEERAASTMTNDTTNPTTTSPTTQEPEIEYEYTICENWVIEMVCDEDNQYIQINSLFYGRKDNETCPDNEHFTHNISTNCSTPPGSFEKLRRYCNGRLKCWFAATYDQWGVHDQEPECWSVLKEATVSYSCIDCSDKLSGNECKKLKDNGKCEAEYDTMMDICYKTCTKCGTKDCGNAYQGPNGLQACDGWAMNRRGECVAAPQYMQQQCKESCLACTQPQQDLNNTSPSTTAAATSSVTSDVTLSDGWHGRVEVVYNGEKGTICDDSWSGENCKVLCKQLNFSGGTATINAYDGPGTGMIWLDHVVCDGTEASLTDCQHNDWGVHNCDHTEDAGCICDPPDSNITKPAGYEFHVHLSHQWYGRVEVIYNNMLGTLCDDGWTDEDCKVLCNQLDYSGGTAYCCAKYGPGTGPIWLDHLQCDGTEEYLHQCKHNPPGMSNCDHTEDASCVCHNPNKTVVIDP